MQEILEIRDSSFQSERNFLASFAILAKRRLLAFVILINSCGVGNFSIFNKDIDRRSRSFGSVVDGCYQSLIPMRDLSE
jgi:hypothetical protein